MINVDELFEKRYGGKSARQYFEENESFTPIEMVNFAKHCIEQLNKPAVMQAEGSDVSEGAAVGQRSGGTNAEARECETCKHLESENPYPCGKCDENYCMWEAPSGGHL